MLTANSEADHIARWIEDKYGQAVLKDCENRSKGEPISKSILNKVICDNSKSSIDQSNKWLSTSCDSD